MASSNLFFFPFLSLALLQAVFAVDTVFTNNTGDTQVPGATPYIFPNNTGDTQVPGATPYIFPNNTGDTQAPGPTTYIVPNNTGDTQAPGPTTYIVPNNTGDTAVDYIVTNNAGDTPGGIRFDNVIGANYSRLTLVAATAFIWDIFQQRTATDRKNVQKVSLFIDRSFGGVSFTTNNEIHVAANYISNYAGDVKRKITGILYHEMTHIWQWNGNLSAPGGLIEGIADYVRLKSGYISGPWVGPGGGSRWDQGYDVTARFLEYLEGRRSGFVAELNRKLRNGYSADYFRQISRKTVDELWAEYKSNYENNVDKKCSNYEIEVNGVFPLQL